jgi:hypothetical protein
VPPPPQARAEPPPSYESDSDTPMMLRSRRGCAQTEVGPSVKLQTRTVQKTVMRAPVVEAVEDEAVGEAPRKQRNDRPETEPMDAEPRPVREESLPSTEITAGSGIWAIKPKKRPPSRAPDSRPTKQPYFREERYTRPRSVSPDSHQLTRQQIIDLENTGHALKTGISRYRRLGAANITRAQAWAIRMALHKAPFLVCNARYRDRVTPYLSALLNAAEELDIPADMVADAEYLLSRWMQDDFDADLLRGIDKTLRIADQRRVTTQSIDKEYRFKRSAATPGHNGLVIGQWWPLQICAVRDGAHGAIEAGIYGDREAAISVIVSGGGYNDEDMLQVIWYCGTMGEGPGMPSANTLAMLNAMTLKRPVRVLRSAKAKSVYAPAEGIRYDGLYSVTEKQVVDESYAMMRFKLVRCAGQQEVRWKGDGIRPTSMEREKWADMKDAWKLMA